MTSEGHLEFYVLICRFQLRLLAGLLVFSPAHIGFRFRGWRFLLFWLAMGVKDNGLLLQHKVKVLLSENLVSSVLIHFKLKADTTQNTFGLDAQSLRSFLWKNYENWCHWFLVLSQPSQSFCLHSGVFWEKGSEQVCRSFQCNLCLSAELLIDIEWFHEDFFADRTIFGYIELFASIILF